MGRQGVTHGGMSQVPAGWYLDPHADNTERWWGGTAWTANARPMNDTPAQGPPPPFPAAGALPPDGWCADSQNPAEEKWLADWTHVTRQRAGQQPTVAPGLRGSISGQTPQAAGSPEVFYNGHRQGFATAPDHCGRSSRGFVLAGLVFAAVGLVAGAAMRTPANMSATTTGTVASVQFSQNRRTTSTACGPVANFEVGGKTYTAYTSERVSPCPWAVGQPVAVAYDPASPARATIPSAGWVWCVPWIFGGIGVLLLAGRLFPFVRSIATPGAGGLSLLHVRRRRRANTPPE